MPVSAPRAVTKRTAQNELVQRVRAWPQPWSRRVGQVGPHGVHQLFYQPEPCAGTPSPTALHLLDRRAEEKKVKPRSPTPSFNFPQTPSPNSLAPSPDIWVAQGQVLLPFTPPEQGCRGGSMSPPSSQTCPSQLPAQPPPSITSCEPGDGLPPSNSHVALTKMLP